MRYPYKSIRHTINQNGFTLIELLLVVGITTTLILIGIRIFDNWSNKIADQGEAAYLTQLMSYAQEYVDNNFEYIWTNPALMAEGFNDNSLPVNGTFEVVDGDNILFDGNADTVLNNADLTNVGRVLKLGITGPVVGNPADFFLQDIIRGTAPASFLGVTPLKYVPDIYIRNRGYISGKRSLEIFVVTNANAGQPLLSYARINNMASIIGSDAAAWGRVDPITRNIFVGGFCTAGNVVQSINGTWQLTANVLNVPFAINANNGHCPTVVPPSNGEGAYIALRRITEHEESFLPNVVYRNDITGRPELARMQANLNMRGNALSGVQAMSADRLNVQRNLSINNDMSQIFVEETGRFAGPNSRITANPIAPAAVPGRTCRWLPGSPRSLDPVAAGNCDLAGGNLLITGESLILGNDALELQNLNANAALIEVDNVDANITRVANQVNISTGVNVGTVSAGQVSIDNLNVTGNVTTGDIISQDLRVNGTATVASVVTDDISTQGLNAQNMNVVSVSGLTGNVDVNNNLDLYGPLNTNQAQINNLADCDARVVHRMDLDGDMIFYEIPDDLQAVALYDCILGP